MPELGKGGLKKEKIEYLNGKATRHSQFLAGVLVLQYVFTCKVLHQSVWRAWEKTLLSIVHPAWKACCYFSLVLQKKSKSCRILTFILILIDVLATDMWTAICVLLVTVMGFVCVFACFVKRETCQEDLWECEPSLQMASYLFGGNHLMELASEVHTADPKVIPVDMERATEGWAMLQCCKSDKTRKQEN